MKKPTKDERIAVEKQKLDKTLKRSGYFECVVKHGKSLRPEFPDLKSSLTPYTSLGNGFAKTTGKRELPPDAKQFPIGAGHKQGYELMYSKAYASQLNGKKT